MAILVNTPPCVMHEDEHLLVVNKPPGLNTHSPSPHAGEGIYEWLRDREERWSSLALIHRLDKATSGVMVFAKTRIANQSLTEQFAQRTVRKRYLLLTSTRPAERNFTVRSGLVRTGDRYTATTNGDFAQTRFSVLEEQGDRTLIEAEPLTGRTHQIRAHCALQGHPILGDTLYEADSFHRVCLHAAQLSFQHPVSRKEISFQLEPDFSEPAPSALRRLMIDGQSTNVFRSLHGASDNASLYLERWGDYLLAMTESALAERDVLFLKEVAGDHRGVYHKLLNRQVARSSPQESAPQLILGSPAPAAFTVAENGVQYEISFQQGYSVGLFLDQRDNRRRLLTNHVAPDFPLNAGGLAGRSVLNTFAYTCGYSLCAALAGARTTSLDLSKKYLEWGQRNFRLNGLNSDEHDFIYGDVFDWVQRLRKKGRRFDIVLIDPPTFSRGKDRVFQADRDYASLATAILPLLEKNGVLFASTNAHKLAPADFLKLVEEGAGKAGRKILKSHYVPQPLDFPISRAEPAYLKTVWLQME